MLELCPRFRVAIQEAMDGDGYSHELNVLAVRHTVLVGRLSGISAALEWHRGGAMEYEDADTGERRGWGMGDEELALKLAATASLRQEGNRVLGLAGVREAFALDAWDCAPFSGEDAIRALMRVMCPGQTRDDPMQHAFVLPHRGKDGRWVVYLPTSDIRGEFRLVDGRAMRQVPRRERLLELFGASILAPPRGGHRA